jgi:hypothetical protein
MNRKKTRNPNLEIRNKHEAPKSQNSKQSRAGGSVSVIRASNFEFVSDFEIRISDFMFREEVGISSGDERR